MAQGDRTMRTIKQMADELGISKQTAYRWIKRNHISEAHQDGKTMQYDDAVFSRMKTAFSQDNATSEAHQNTSNHINDTNDDTMLKWYQDQIAAKDKQIEELHQLLNQSHQIQGALLAENTKLHALVEASQHEPEDPVQAPEGKEEEVPANESEAVQAISEAPEVPIIEQHGEVPPQAKRSLLEKLRAAFNEFKKD